jgi:hypothetical protein
MHYASGENPITHDRIRDSNGDFGTLSSCDGTVLTVNWDEGVVDIDYTAAERFTLISRASEVNKIDG